ncbi:MAG: PhoH family protein [Gammaproteobacteria bacterium]|nr:PhoH family protein [Gammaproteobacteria bacterium]NND40395.1 PhoH family protein [Pseudomonadales bacterium]NNL11991.1 PhoH family protein [Pseudomonadales bacterium]NNM11443.1 PhoH family protein [Pseudomonadales bacterium]RZV57305.1 MAG: PhoH family protein [Pseudomonadales bacterium]
MNKIFVLDTNVLLHDPMAIHAFAEHRVVIPMTVLEELDAIKDRRDKDVSREARIAINAIDDILENASPKAIQQGVEIPGTAAKRGTLAIFPDQLIDHSNSALLLNNPVHHYNDDRIINVALHLQAEDDKRVVCLVTKDINMRLKAKGSGLEHVEDYKKDKVVDDIEFMAKGYEQYQGDFWAQVEKVETLHGDDGSVRYRLDRAYLPDAYPQMLVFDEQQFAGQVLEVGEKHIEILHLDKDRLLEQTLWGISPRNFEQAMAFHLIQRDDVDLMVMTGPAGSGKTLIALAYGLQAILEEKRFDKIVVARSTPPIAEDIGFLPGTEEEKMAPWLAAFDDNLEVLHSGDENMTSSIEYIKERANIQFKSLNFMRGRSFNNAYIIIDEAQGLTQFQLKSIITRVGNNSKIIVLGNLAQIDNKYISPLTSGLTYLVEKSKAFQHAAIMHVNGIERSRIAAFAEEQL